MLQCLEVVTGLAQAFFAVFDGLGGAVADAGHAVGTLAAPYRPACCQADVVQRAALDALSASDAAVIRLERPGLDEEPVKDRVDRPAHKTVVQILAGGGKRLSGLDAVNGLLDSRGGAVHDAPGLGRVRGGEHGNVVLRHLDGGGTHGAQLLALCQPAVIVVGAADLAAAVHHKPDALCLGQRRGLQPLLYDPGDAPGVGGGHQHDIRPGLHRGGVRSLDADIQVQRWHAEGLCDLGGDIPAVAGAGKIQYHHSCPFWGRSPASSTGMPASCSSAANTPWPGILRPVKLPS